MKFHGNFQKKFTLKIFVGFTVTAAGLILGLRMATV
jgi:hypothetical protein